MYDLFPPLVDVYPLHIGAVRHQVYRLLVGEIKHLLVDDVLLRIDHTLTGCGFQHCPQLHLGDHLTSGSDADQLVDETCRKGEHLHERVEDNAYQMDGGGNSDCQLLRVVQCHGLGHQLSDHDGEIGDHDHHHHHGNGIGKWGQGRELLEERHQVFGKSLSTVSTVDDANQGDPHLHRREEVIRVGAQ